ncbi:MAG TPA: peptide chain release factor N(5)-glutamine methyltransferase [Candidatus Acidoferrales bacterium]|nr:peptide chain release factor N(5)-glutamine methyltransferase [Candidatus Acidoferrales bacterium]
MARAENAAGATAARATVAAALRTGTELLRRRGIDSARLDAEVLLAAALDCRREDLYARPERVLEAAEAGRYREWLWRRAGREPVAYIVGGREFWSLEFAVGPGVFIPRPETELLVELALKLLPGVGERGRALRVLDLCAGSGAIGVSLARERADIELWGVDLSAEAVKSARQNAMRHGVSARSRFVQGDLFSPVAAKGRFFDALVANPPYVRRAELERLPPEVRNWEPRLALDGGADGLDFYRRIVREAPEHVQDGGFVLVEIGAELARAVCELFAAAGYGAPAVYADYAGSARAVSVAVG